MTRWHAQLLERLDHKDMAEAARATAYRFGTFLAAYGLELPLDRLSQPASVARVSLDRPMDLAASAAGEALRTIKLDAAARLFDLDFSRSGWAIIDSGISPVAGLRVEKAWDFSNLVNLLRQAMGSPEAQAGLKAEIVETFRRRDFLDVEDRADALIASIRRREAAGRELDWEMVEPVLNVDPSRPELIPILDGRPIDHATAIAGILAANPDESPGKFAGACPGIRLFDLRVTRVVENQPAISEFAVIAALQFLRWYNSSVGRPEISGANVSLQVHHNVRSYGCGATPVCREVNRTVESGVTVVAAAGNGGFREMADTRGNVAAFYFGMTVTDPGNADLAITVGATHRRDPYTHGVSHFSGKGPTGDGRRKPDLVAPGEKISAISARGGLVEVDGTSFAAAFVSAAAAMLMARYPELVGNPRRVKAILLASASDLGRDPGFQGAGLLDTLRALQSV
jgi:subtilisin family serine protease